ncbi:MAG TPA: NAD(P)H-hydrate dehydratase [Candidatus Acidoferrales bacterium]|nr:NAD(P)H-hydrate dehydratase [Candidatus Acidoferrales bacterium]
MKILTATEMREVDRLTTERYGIPSLTLMENAGRSVAEFIRDRFPHLERRRIVVLCGKGNNGGDGFVVARQLQKMGAKPVVLLVAKPEEIKGGAAKNLIRLKRSVKVQAVADDALRSTLRDQTINRAQSSKENPIIIDALLGTGIRGAVHGAMAKAIGWINDESPGAVVISVDIPSGLDSDTGEVHGTAVAANHTVTFTAPKRGMVLGDASRAVGQLVVCDIGSPPELIDEVGKGDLSWSEPREFCSKFAAPRAPGGNKGDYGHALIVAGSVGKTGAAVLASWAALRVGAGLVTVATPEPALSIIAMHTPEVMTEPLAATTAGTISPHSLDGGHFDSIAEGKRVIGIGPGLTTNDQTQEFVHKVVGRRSTPIILDADGLNAFAGRALELKNPNGLLGLTPHPGEMARLLGSSIKDVQANRVEIALKAAADWNAVVVLKGHQTVIASPSGQAFINSTGNPGMGTGGTGDALTGMLSGLVAQFGRGLDYSGYAHLLAFGVYLHGLAGDIAYADHDEAPLMASDLIYAIPRAYQRFYSECGRG